MAFSNTFRFCSSCKQSRPLSDQRCHRLSHIIDMWSLLHWHKKPFFLHCLHERNYQETMARLREENKLSFQTDCLKLFPTDALTKATWIQKAATPVQQMRELLTFFGVADIVAGGHAGRRTALCIVILRLGKAASMPLLLGSGRGKWKLRNSPAYLFILERSTLPWRRFVLLWPNNWKSYSLKWRNGVLCWDCRRFYYRNPQNDCLWRHSLTMPHGGTHPT